MNKQNYTYIISPVDYAGNKEDRVFEPETFSSREEAENFINDMGSRWVMYPNIEIYKVKGAGKSFNKKNLLFIVGYDQYGEYHSGTRLGRKNPYYLIKGEKRESYFRDEPKGKKYMGDTRGIRDLEFPDIATAHQVAKLAGLETYKIADTKDDWGREAVFKTKDILEYEAKSHIAKEESKMHDIAKVERLGKSPRHFVIKRYGKVVIYAERSTPDYRPGHFSGVRVYPHLYITTPKRKRQFFDIEEAVKNKKKFMDNYAYLFGGSSAERARPARYNRYSRSYSKEFPAKKGVYPEPLPTIAQDLPEIKKEYDRTKREVWSNPRRKPQWRRKGESLQSFETRRRRFTDRVIGDMTRKKNPVKSWLPIALIGGLAWLLLRK